MQRVTVVGLGYMGLPTALLFAREPGREVYGFDVDGAKVRRLQNGELPFEETGLAELYAETRERFHADTALHPSDAFVLALPTPIDAARRCDTGYLEAAIDALAPVIEDGNLVVIESTVSPGTTLRMRERLRGMSQKAPVFAYVSEKAIPGNTLHEMVHNDRIIGLADEAAREPTAALYQGFVRGELVFTSATTAEATKLFENTYRDVNIALANELADISQALGIDAHEAIELANRHPRVALLQPGPGVGGHCIAVDPWFLIEEVPDARLVALAREINDRRPAQIADLLHRHLDGRHARVALLGAAYKSDVDDDRESPSYAVRDCLQALGHRVRIHDPYVARPGVERDLHGALGDAEAVVLMTSHTPYRDLELHTAGFCGELVLDTVGLWRHRPPNVPNFVRVGTG